MTVRELARADLPGLGRALAYAACVGLTCVVLAAGLRLDHYDPKIPLLDSGDALLILPMVQARHEGGSHWVNERMGAPGRQELYDFPVIDSLHFAAVALIDAAVDHPVVAFNTYFLLTYPLAAFCAMLAGRCLGLSLPAAGCLGLLYAFLPYHQYRGLSHYFLSAYFLLPLALVVAVNLALGRVRLRRAGWPVAVMVATSCAGAYYAFFVCVMLAVAAPYGALLRRSVRPLAWGLLFVGVVVACGVANHAPTFAHHAEFGANTRPAQRHPEDTVIYGLKMTYLVLPIPDHRVPALANLRAAHDGAGRWYEAESNTSMLGVVGVAGLVLGAVTLFHPRLRRRRVARAVAALTTAAILVATIGGVGALFSELVNPSVRAQARMSVVIAFLALWLALAALDRTPLLRRSRYARWAVFAAVGAVGLLDTTPRDWGHWSMVEARDRLLERHDADRLFYGSVEATLGGGTVFQLPFNEYPEGVAEGGNAMGSYDLARGFLHTKTTRWSFGAMKGREADQWQRDVSAAEVPEMLRRVTLCGFDGLVIDWQFYTPAAAEALAKAVAAELRSDGPSLSHGVGGRVFHDLRPHRARLQSELGNRYAELARAEAEAVRVLWFRGFDKPEPGVNAARACARRGEAWLVNPSDRPRRVTMTMVARTGSALPSTLRVAGAVWDETRTIDAASGIHTVTVEVPPGRHRAAFECEPTPDWSPRDAQRHVFTLAQFRLTEDP